MKKLIEKNWLLIAFIGLVIEMVLLLVGLNMQNSPINMVSSTNKDNREVSLGHYTEADILSTVGTVDSAKLYSEKLGVLYKGTALECATITAIISPLTLTVKDYYLEHNMITFSEYQTYSKNEDYFCDHWVLQDSEQDAYLSWMQNQYDSVIEDWLLDEENFDSRGKLKLKDY